MLTLFIEIFNFAIGLLKTFLQVRLSINDANYIWVIDVCNDERIDLIRVSFARLTRGGVVMIHHRVPTAMTLETISPT